MKALFVAWQEPESRRWAPVGRLTRDGGLYHFVYTRGAKDSPSFMPFGRMRDLTAEYVSDTLFPLFANRVLAKSRPEYRDYLAWLGLSAERHDVLEELARTGGVRATDSLELFPCPEPTAANEYEVYFFTHGLRHLQAESQRRVIGLVPGERLFLMQDLQNEHDAMALLLRTADPVSLVGYAPRYYAGEFTQLIKAVGPSEVRVTVEKVNLDAPTQYRMLCRLVAPWPANFAPCRDDQFEPLARSQSQLFAEVGQSAGR